jgi:hypothetical protein
LLNIRGITLLGIAVLLTVGFAYQFRYFHQTVEDAWISLRYAKNLADGYGLVFNPLGHHEEGYSNLSLVLLVALLGKLKFDFLIAAKLIGIVSVYVTSFFILWLAREFSRTIENSKEALNFYIVFLLTTISSYLFSNWTAYWATSGLETKLYECGLASLYACLIAFIIRPDIKKVILASVLCGCLVITRPEALLNIPIALIFIFLSTYIKKDKLDAFVYATRFSLIVLGFVGIYFSWRLYYHGEWISNPAMVKLAMNKYQPVSQRIQYIFGYFIDQSIIKSLFFLVGLIGLGTRLISDFKARSFNQLSYALALAFVFLTSQWFFVFYAGADYMPQYRFLATHAFFESILVGYGAVFSIRLITKQQFQIFLAIFFSLTMIVLSVKKGNALPSWWSTGFTWPSATNVAYGPPEHIHSVREIENVLRSSNSTTYAHSEAGYIPYHLGHLVGIDIMGLNDHVIAKTYAMMPTDEAAAAARDYVLSRMPKVISTWGYAKKDEQFVFSPSVAWFFEPYFKSNFFLSHYNIEFGSDQNEYKMYANTFKDDFVGINHLDAQKILAETKDRDKLMYGFYIDEGINIWVAPVSRILLTRLSSESKIRISGWVPDINLYLKRQDKITIYLNDKSVGDLKIGETTVKREGEFELTADLPESFLNTKNLLVTITGEKLTPRNQDIRSLSWGLKSIALY